MWLACWLCMGAKLMFPWIVCSMLSWWATTDYFHKRGCCCRSPGPFHLSSLWLVLMCLCFQSWRLALISLLACICQCHIYIRGGRCGLLTLCHADDQDLLSVSGRIQVSCGEDDCLSECEVICSSLDELSWLNLASPCQAVRRNEKTNMSNPPDLIIGLAKQHPQEPLQPCKY